MLAKLRLSLTTTTILLLASVACTRTDNSSSAQDSELIQLKQDYLRFQQEHQSLLLEMAKIRQENEAFKAGLADGIYQDTEIKNQFILTQKKLNSQQQEYQSLQKDYAQLEASIEPLAERLKASMAAHHKELIGTKLDSLELKNGRHIKQGEVTEITNEALQLKFSGGLIWITYAELPTDIQERFFFDPLLISSNALLSKKPDAPKTVPSPKDKQNVHTPSVEEAFAERNRQVMAQHKLSVEKKVTNLKKDLIAYNKRLNQLNLDRSNLSKKMNKGGGIKTSAADRNKAFNSIDIDIGKMKSAVKATETRITSWEKELAKPAVIEK